jgi:hypothetical protein
VLKLFCSVNFELNEVFNVSKFNQNARFLICCDIIQLKQPVICPRYVNNSRPDPVR